VNAKKQIPEESEDLENIVLTDEEIEIGATRLWKLTDAERKQIMPNLTPMQKRFLRCARKGGFENYRIIQEVISVKNCPRQAKVGGKIVYNAMGELRPDDCDAFPVTGYCVQAVMAMLLHAYLVSDRISGGIDPDPIGLNLVRCPNFAPAEGGIGSVVFKVYRVKVEGEVPKFGSNV
jgi:hypothetical protein